MILSNYRNISDLKDAYANQNTLPLRGKHDGKRFTMNAALLRMHPDDNLLMTLRALTKGEVIEADGTEFTVAEDIPAKHQLATQDFGEGDTVTLHGTSAGRVLQPIARGGMLTTKNVVHATQEFEITTSDFTWTPPNIGRWKEKTFDGYHRSDGRVGTANHWLIIPLVFCENRNLVTLREALVEELGYSSATKYRSRVKHLLDAYRKGDAIADTADALGHVPTGPTTDERVFPNVDGVQFLLHMQGCGGMDQDAEALCRLLASYINHPNVCGATVLSLGCQKAQVSLLEKELTHLNPNFDKPLVILEQQDIGTEEKLMTSAIDQTLQGLAEANKANRAPATLDKLTFGMECGGSDGFSGISANPCMGMVSDLIVALGGAAILAEFPELSGVEQDIIHRCVDEATAKRFVELMTRYEERAMNLGESFEKNPAPGNVREGLITDAIKSAGAAKKGGTSPVVDVQDYPGDFRKNGLNLLCTPGGDVESTTAMAGAGANMMIFSTGLGTPTGNPIVPVVKVSTSTPLAERMPDIIDFDAGRIITGAISIAEAADELLDLCIQVASGKLACKADILGQNDFIPWKRGLSL
jgi:altronate hydrolase